MSETDKNRLRDADYSKIWVVSTVVPGSLDPCFPEVFPTREAAEAHLDERLKEEWECHGDCDDAGKRLPYPDDWRQALAAMSKDPLWGRWELTAHRIPAPEVESRLRVAKALEACDWSGVSIGNKAIIGAAIDALKTGVPTDPAVRAATPDWKAIATELAAAALNCGDQISQMSGLFEDSVGQIAESLGDAGAALERFYEADGKDMPWRAWNEGEPKNDEAPSP